MKLNMFEMFVNF